MLPPGPQTAGPKLLADAFASPGIGSEDERLHRFECAQHGLHVRAATTLAPTDQAIIADCLDDNVCYPIAIHPRTYFAVSVWNADWNKFQIRDSHRGYAISSQHAEEKLSCSAS